MPGLSYLFQALEINTEKAASGYWGLSRFRLHSITIELQ